MLDRAVRDHQIEQVRLTRHENGQGAPAEVLTNQIVQEQTLELDAVAGATVSSRCILKAVQNALEQGAI